MLNDLLIRLRALFWRGSFEKELDEELRFHFEEQVQKFAANRTCRGLRTEGPRVCQGFAVKTKLMVSESPPVIVTSCVWVP